MTPADQNRNSGRVGGDPLDGVAIHVLPGSEAIANRLGEQLRVPVHPVSVQRLPDGEARVRVAQTADAQQAVLVCSLRHPDEHLLPLIFAAGTLRELGCTVGLVAPYLAYMRQDGHFADGEAVSARHFALLLSRAIDWLVTLDPHLHRFASLGEIFTIPTDAVHAGEDIAQWLVSNVASGFVVGPDGESAQWARAVAEHAKMPVVVLTKTRHDAASVEVSVPDVGRWRDRTPVLIDDIIATGDTMVETIHRLRQAGMRAPVCVGIHAVFAGDAFASLMRAGAARVVTTNTIPHESNAIDVSARLAQAVDRLLRLSPRFSAR